jgi:hypothetical protein
MIIRLCILLFVVSLVSCDPARILLVRCPSKPGSSVELYARKGILGSWPQQDSLEKVTLQLPFSAAGKDTSFLYGVGTWTDERIANFAAHTDSIVLTNSKGRQVYNSREAIIQYLRKNRTGAAKSLLTIEAE